MAEQAKMRDTRWLAQRLSLSVTTIERMRAEKPRELPPGIKIGAVYRYCEERVEDWLTVRQNQSMATSEPQEARHD